MVTRTIPTVKLPAGVIPTPQAGTSQDTLAKMKESVASPTLPIGAKIIPQAQVAQPTADA